MIDTRKKIYTKLGFSVYAEARMSNWGPLYGSIEGTTQRYYWDKDGNIVGVVDGRGVTNKTDLDPDLSICHESPIEIFKKKEEKEEVKPKVQRVRKVEASYTTKYDTFDYPYANMSNFLKVTSDD